MDFRRRKKRGQSRKVIRYWFSEEGYRIIWRREVYGVQVPARFQASVRTVVPNYGGEEGKLFEMWDFVTKPRLYKTLKAAQEDCERHKRLWAKACEATGVRGLIEIFGKLPMAFPVWAKKKLPRKVMEILTRPRTAKYQDECESSTDPDPADPTRTSDSSVSSTEVMLADHIPALFAKAEGGSKKLTTRRNGSKRTAAVEPSAKPAKETAKAQRKRAAKHTKRPSKRTGKKTPSTADSLPSGDKPARSSRKTRAKRSKS